MSKVDKNWLRLASLLWGSWKGPKRSMTDDFVEKWVDVLILGFLGRDLIRPLFLETNVHSGNPRC